MNGKTSEHYDTAYNTLNFVFVNMQKTVVKLDQDPKKLYVIVKLQELKLSEAFDLMWKFIYVEFM